MFCFRRSTPVDIYPMRHVLENEWNWYLEVGAGDPVPTKSGHTFCWKMLEVTGCNWLVGSTWTFGNWTKGGLHLEGADPTIRDRERLFPSKPDGWIQWTVQCGFRHSTIHFKIYKTSTPINLPGETKFNWTFLRHPQVDMAEWSTNRSLKAEASHLSNLAIHILIL